MTVQEVADVLGISEDTVRRKASELGGFKIGEGRTRSPYRFPTAAIFNYMKTRHAQLQETR